METIDRSGQGKPATVTILVCTYNRASFLSDTLSSLSGLTAETVAWDVLIVDNNSTDATADLVREAQSWFPVPLRYVFEPRQGKSIALNTGLAAVSSDIVVFTDDDVRVPSHWLEAASAPLAAAEGPDYTGGPARPLWEAQPPSWLALDGNLAATIAVLDYGPEPFCFEDRGLIPLGVNMASRRPLLDRVGGFHPDLGRIGQSLLGQEQAEFFERCRRVGARGLYVPDMWLEHYVPASRLRLAYFIRWSYYKGISQARWHSIHGRTETGVDLTRTPRFLGVPRYLFRQLFGDAVRFLLSIVKGDRAGAVHHGLSIAYRSGYCKEMWIGKRHEALAA
jgi:glucosyl-dolichyl phosphate glucuronosyltransferase